jgi:amino acid adenylation domain-containing protein
MIPSNFVQLETIPLTANGKIDRHALPDPGGRRPELDVQYLAPSSEEEQIIAKIISECTGIEQVGIHDNFFELGGDSLTLARVLSRLNGTFQRRFSIQELFEAPSIAAIVGLLDSAPQHAAALVEAAGAPVASDTWLPLSFSQQRLWFLDQLDPGGFAYNVFAAYRLKGDLKLAALEQSFNEIIRRHEVLRTVFRSHDGSPVQVVLPSLAIEMPLVDLRALASEKARWTETRRMFRQEAQRPFDLSTGPLLRILLLQLADDEFVLLRAMHHIVSDGWSGGILLRELSELYKALSTEQPSSLAELPIQYADFARWQRQTFAGERLEAQLSYWKKQLENLAPVNLSTDRPRQTVQARDGGRRYFSLSNELSAALKKLSREHGTTLFITLLAAYQTLLQRYSHQTDIAIGSPVAGRTGRDFDELIGFFLNMLMLRLDFSGKPTFTEMLARAREVCLGALNHQELPFEKLVEELHPDRSLGQNPLFQLTFAFQNTPRVTPQLSGVEVEELEIETGIARFDVHLFMEEIDDHLQGYCDYDSNLFEADTIERLLGHFQRLLEGIVEDPDQRIADLPLLSDAEKHRLLIEWNATGKDYPRDKCIHELFEEQVELAPEAAAVVFGNRQITYRELNGRASQLAHYLRRQGVRPDTLVALFMQRSLELVIAILGVLKAGAAYMPIDTDLPVERIEFLLRDSCAGLILTQDKFRGGVASFAGEVVCLDGDRTKASDESRENPEPAALGHHAAYVIYTSGSTGTPKGVVNIHDGLRNRIQWMQQSYRLTASDRVLQKTPYTFDVSVWEFLWPLSSGACLVLARPDGHRDSAYLVELVESQRITTLHFVPSMLDVFLRERGIERCTSLRQVFCSGEALAYDLQQRYFERSPAALYNLYGPTEASIDVIAWECRRDGQTKIVPIGRPIANTQIHILDNHLNPVPIGVPGELHIGGKGLARGYLNRPELTEEKFISNPFSTDPDARLYKTGDLARYLLDGNIEFLGRMDNQVKVRGYRIELGEIESVLAQHPAIQQAAVLAREDTPGDKRLVAYVVARTEAPLDAAEVKKYLKQKLPEYMIPSALELLDELPLTPSGKVDRRALPAPDRGRREAVNVYRVPGTPTEEALATIWREVLKLDRVGIDDNFFALGGHSLLATQVVSRMCDAFSIELTLRQMFKTPTIAELAAILDQNRVMRTSDSELEQMLREALAAPIT